MTHERSAQVEILRQTADRLGISREVDPAEALLELVWEAAGNVEFYRSLVEALPIHPEDDELVMSDVTGLPYWQRGAPGIYGRTYHQSGIPTGEAKRVILVQMYDDERDRLERYVKDALAAKIDERRVQIAERDARELFTSVGRAMTAAQLTPEQAETFRRELANDLRRPKSAQLAS